MSTTAEPKKQLITSLLNGTLASLHNVVPLNLSIDKTTLLNHSLNIEFGVLIGLIGDIKGKLILTGDAAVFGAIGESMFGMPLEGGDVVSFSGELGNMIAGGLSSNMVENGSEMDITSPTIMQGDTAISGFKMALHLPATFENAGKMDIYLLID